MQCPRRQIETSRKILENPSPAPTSTKNRQARSPLCDGVCSGIGALSAFQFQRVQVPINSKPVMFLVQEAFSRQIRGRPMFLGEAKEILKVRDVSSPAVRPGP